MSVETKEILPELRLPRRERAEQGRRVLRQGERLRREHADVASLSEEERATRKGLDGSGAVTLSGRRETLDHHDRRRSEAGKPQGEHLVERSTQTSCVDAEEIDGARGEVKGRFGVGDRKEVAFAPELRVKEALDPDLDPLRIRFTNILREGVHRVEEPVELVIPRGTTQHKKCSSTAGAEIHDETGPERRHQIVLEGCHGRIGRTPGGRAVSERGGQVELDHERHEPGVARL